MFPHHKIIAHRGAWNDFQLPQNSIAAFIKAQELSIGGVELDIQLTKDEQLIVFHDDFILDDPINEKLLKNLAKHRLHNGECLPTFSTFLSHWKHQIPLWVEIKSTLLSTPKKIKFVDQLLNTINSDNLPVYIISFDQEALMLVQDRSDFPTLLLLENSLPIGFTETNLSGYDINYQLFNSDINSIKLLKNNELILNSWTVNDYEVGTKLIERGVDFITTDELMLFMK